jgi:ribosome assembly protein YihI (activator of Der GTPase)
MRNTLSLFFCLMLLVSCGSAEEVPVKVDEPVKVNPTETESEKPVEEARSIEEMRDEVHELLDEITEADDTVTISFSMQVDNPIAVK